jgi:hypothetical protein
MTSRSWLRTRFAHPVTRPIRKAPARCRPALEALEETAGSWDCEGDDRPTGVPGPPCRAGVVGGATFPA